MKRQIIAACLAISISTLASADDRSISEPQRLVAEKPGEGDLFGSGVAVRGSTAVIGALTHEFGMSSGSAFVFERDTDGFWHEVAKVIASDAAAGDEFGYAIAMSGNTFVASAAGDDDHAFSSGAAYIFDRDAQGFWHEVKKLTASDPAEEDFFGMPAISADTLVVAAVGEDSDVVDAGAAYIFERNAGGTDNWGEVKKLQPEDLEQGDNFGTAVAIEDDVVAVGTSYHGSTGAVYLFGRNTGGAGNWGLIKKLAPAGAVNLGVSVSLSGDVLVSGSSVSHTVFIFERDLGGPDNWGLVRTVSRGQALFGNAVAVSGDVLVVGDREGPDGEGAAWVFHRDAGGMNRWGQVAALAEDSDFRTQLFGESVATNGGSVLIAAPYYSDPIPAMGAVYAYTLEQPDSDGDGVNDPQDNCIEAFNPDQRDTDTDGFGNFCDADLDNDCSISFPDLGAMKSVFLQSGNLDADLNGDQHVNFGDLGLMKQAFFGPPGPSGVPNACSP